MRRRIRAKQGGHIRAKHEGHIRAKHEGHIRAKQGGHIRAKTRRSYQGKTQATMSQVQVGLTVFALHVTFCSKNTEKNNAV